LKYSSFGYINHTFVKQRIGICIYIYNLIDDYVDFILAFILGLLTLCRQSLINSTV